MFGFICLFGCLFVFAITLEVMNASLSIFMCVWPDQRKRLLKLGEDPDHILDPQKILRLLQQ